MLKSQLINTKFEGEHQKTDFWPVFFPKAYACVAEIYEKLRPVKCLGESTENLLKQGRRNFFEKIPQKIADAPMPSCFII